MSLVGFNVSLLAALAYCALLRLAVVPQAVARVMVMAGLAVWTAVMALRPSHQPIDPLAWVGSVVAAVAPPLAVPQGAQPLEPAVFVAGLEDEALVHWHRDAQASSTHASARRTAAEEGGVEKKTVQRRDDLPSTPPQRRSGRRRTPSARAIDSQFSSHR